MIKANHPEAGYFTEYIYKLNGTEGNNNFDVILGDCRQKSPDGFNCENCYKGKLREKLAFSYSYLSMKKFLTYQLGLYANPTIWVKELKRCLEHDIEFKVNYELERLIDDVLEDIIEIETPQADLDRFITITNIFEGATIHQQNFGGNNSQSNSYVSVLEQMETDGVSTEIVEEGKELLKDANKSDSLKKIAGNWIKGLPFKFMEKSGEWAIANTNKISEYQDSLMTWINNL